MDDRLRVPLANIHQGNYVNDTKWVAYTLAETLFNLDDRLTALEAGAASREMQPSSPAIESPAGQPSTSSTSSCGFFLAREDITGGLLFTATVTFPGLSSPEIRGRVLRLLRVGGWMPVNPEMLEWRWPSGFTSSPVKDEVPAAQAGGPSVGGRKPSVRDEG